MSTGPLPRRQTATQGGGTGAGRRSYGLEQITEYLRGFEGGQVIDFGGACQSNIDYVTGLGHRLYAEDVLVTLAGAAGAGTIPGDCFAFPRSSVHAVLCWDRLQFLSEPQLGAVLDRLHRVLAPGGLLLAIFHPEQAPTAAPLTCRVAGDGQLLVTAAAGARPFRPFNTRAIERLFQNFESVKLYLTRDNLQEVIVRR